MWKEETSATTPQMGIFVPWQWSQTHLWQTRNIICKSILVLAGVHLVYLIQVAGPCPRVGIHPSRCLCALASQTYGIYSLLNNPDTRTCGLNPASTSVLMWIYWYNKTYGKGISVPRLIWQSAYTLCYYLIAFSAYLFKQSYGELQSETQSTSIFF